jgi:hypothetical protein
METIESWNDQCAPLDCSNIPGVPHEGYHPDLYEAIGFFIEILIWPNHMSGLSLRT